MHKLATTLLFSAFAAAAAPNFTGTWKLNEQQSGGGRSAPRGIVFQIQHNEPLFKYTAAGFTAGGHKFTEALEFTTDGKPHPGPDGTRGAARWEGSVLVIQFTQTSGEPLAKVRYELSAGGQMLRETIIHGRETPRREVYDKQ